MARVEEAEARLGEVAAGGDAAAALSAELQQAREDARREVEEAERLREQTRERLLEELSLIHI